MIAFLVFLLAVELPSASKTSWMRPESFHLTIGMTRAETLQKLEAWKLKKGDDTDHLVIDYGDDKEVTLGFHRDRLTSVRFELFAFLPDAHTAFDEERSFLHKMLGPPKPLKSKKIVAYTDTLPNVMVVLNDDPKSENGQKGLGILVVRYYDPLSPK